MPMVQPILSLCSALWIVFLTDVVLRSNRNSFLPLWHVNFLPLAIKKILLSLFHTHTDTLPVKLSLCSFTLPNASMCWALSALCSPPSFCALCCRQTRRQITEVHHQHRVWTPRGECRGAARRHEAVVRTQRSVRWMSDDMAAALPVCYHGAITKEECEDLLGKKNKDGAYLIRDSGTIQGAMCLCV